MPALARTAALLLAVASVGACDRGPAPMASCDDDLRGVWTARETGVAWHAIRGSSAGIAWELYPLADERPAALPGGVVAGPAFVRLRARGPEATEPGALTGTMIRRYEHRAQRCDVEVPVVLRGCRASTAELAVPLPAVPLDFATCAAPFAAPQTWHLARAR